jgi:MoxR-like ATPase
MENGAILLLDEIDRATNKIMCLQGILEGKPVVVKKTGETITPQPGFNVIATANTKGKGSDDGRFTAASIIDEAFLERFTISIDQQFPSPRVEQKIVMKHMAKFDAIDGDFAENLVAWADIIRKTFYDDGVDEVISTRRLCHIVQTNSIFNDRMKAIDLCIARFDDDTKEAFLDLYSKVDAGVDFNEEQNVEETDEDRL